MPHRGLTKSLSKFQSTNVYEYLQPQTNIKNGIGTPQTPLHTLHAKQGSTANLGLRVPPGAGAGSALCPLLGSTGHTPMPPNDKDSGNEPQETANV